SRTAGGIKVDALPGQMHFLNLAKKHFENRQRLAKFESSPQLPLTIRNAITELAKAVIENTHILLDTINDRLAENPENILQDQNGEFPLLGSTSGTIIVR